MRTSYQGVHVVHVSGVVLSAGSTTAYADNDLVGNKMTLPMSSRGGILQALTIHDLDAQNAALEVYLFRANPTGTTFTDNSALDVADADLPLILGQFSVAASDYLSLADNSVGMVKDLAIPFVCDDGINLYAAFRTAASTPTYTADGLSCSWLALIDPV